MANDTSKSKGPDHSMRSQNTQLPGVIKPGSRPNKAPKVKVTQASAPSGATPPASPTPKA